MQKQSPYRREGRQVISQKTGKTVALIADDGSPVMQPGFRSQGTAVAAFLDSAGAREIPADDLPARDRDGNGKTPRTDPPEKNLSRAEVLVDSIPDSQLPRFDPALGIRTPELSAFIARHHIAGAELEALVRRLERRLRSATQTEHMTI